MWNPFKKKVTASDSEVKTYSIDDVMSMLNGSHLPLTAASKLEVVYSCIANTAAAGGSLPLRLYKRGHKGNSTPITSGALYKLLCSKPNDYMTASDLYTHWIAMLMARGEFYIYPKKNDINKTGWLLPFNQMPSATMDASGNVMYPCVSNDGRSWISDGEDIIRSQNLLFSSYRSTSPIQQNTGLIKGAQDIEKTFQAIQSDGIKSQGYLSTGESVSDQTKTRLVDAMQKVRQAKGGVGSTPLFEEGIKFVPWSLPPKDIELLASRQFSTNRICLMYGVPIEKLGMVDGKTQTKFIDIDEAFFRGAVHPRLVQIESAINRWLELQSGDHYVKFDRAQYYAGNPARLSEYVKDMIPTGVMSIAQGMQALGFDPVEGSDVYAIKTNNLYFDHWRNREQVYQDKFSTDAGQMKPNSKESSDNASSND